MNYIDFIIVLIVLVGALYGLIKGVFRQLGSLGGFVVGILVSRLFGGSFAGLLQQMFDLPAGVSRIVAYSVLFLLVYLVCLQLMRLIHHISHQVALGWLDRLGGALFGAAKYLVILSILLNLVHLVDSKIRLLPSHAVATSHLYQHTLRVAPALFSIAQEQLAAGNKPDDRLFIPCATASDEPYLCCENSKDD
ncbi:CvpA family protein [Barnesiella viscericola]|uniref:CvpA family protein n=1 Tax=Barnesiella viscericola TaxID=397865 RepID=UPI0023526671|nr:CvpA family protein [Barnesiella viscericola]